MAFRYCFVLTVLVVGWVLGGGGSVSVGQPRETGSEQAVRQRANMIAGRADSLREARQLGAAMESYQRAATLYRQLGDEGRRAEMNNEIGILHARQYQYEEALEALRRTVRAYRTRGDSSKVARTLNNVAIVERRMGRDREALDTYRQALDIYEEDENRAVVLNNLGLVHEDLGEYNEALQRFRAALALHRERADTTHIATSLDNVGDVLRRQGRYDEALIRFREALGLYRDSGQRSEVASTLNAIGTIHLKQRQYDEARSRLREAFDIHQELGDTSSAASVLKNTGTLYRERGQHQKALEALREARRMNEEAGDQFDVAKTLNEMGSVHRARGEHDKALGTHREALRLSREVGRAEDVATSLYGIGQAHLAAGRYAEADSVFQASIQITDSLLATATGSDHRDFLAKEVDRFHALALARARSGRPGAALRTLEDSRARVLTDRLSEGSTIDSTADIPSVDSLRATLGPEQAAVLYANTGTERPLTTFVVTRDSIRVHERSESTFRRQARVQFGAAIDRLDLRREIGGPRTSGEGLLRRAKGVDVGTAGGGTLAEMVRLYRHELSAPPREQVLSSARRERLGQYLYDLLLGPIEADLLGREELVIVPDGALSYLPFETLGDWNGQRAIDRWRIRYVQSLRVLHLLQKRDRTEAAPSPTGLLALGGAVYDPATYTADTTGLGHESVATTAPSYASAAGRAAHRSPEAENAHRAYRRLETQRGTIEGYRQLGFGPDRWQNLPGTVTEVRALGRIARPSTLLVGAEAGERTIRRQSDTGMLQEHRVLHLATHGFVVPDRPAFSALVLSEVGADRGDPGGAQADTTGLDGYLTMREISTLEMNAEVVVVSACETGLGRIYRGSGAVSLTQAFLRAGAESVVVSLWPVYDASTSTFMKAVYRKAWDRETTWGEALAQTKRAFAAGDYGKRLQAPRFWAPFVHYGRAR